MVVVCGDHGMSDGGNHGGASSAETSIPVLFIHNRGRFLKQNVVNIDQISLTSTLSVLLNLPIPKNNLGAILSDVLIDLSGREKLYALFYNLHQMVKLKGDVDVDQSVLDMHRKWLLDHRTTGTDEAVNEIDVYNTLINDLSDELSRDLTRQDLPSVLIALFLVSMVFLIIFKLQLNSLRKSFTSLIDKLNIFTWILHSLSFFSSSFIEEEHMLLYFYSATLHLLLLVENLSRKNGQICKYVVLSWICSRFMRNWNQTGDKWASLPDFNKWINKPENQIYLFISLLCAVLLLFIIRFGHTKDNISSSLLLSLAFLLIFISKSLELVNLGSQNFVPTFVYIVITLTVLNDPSIASVVSSWVILSCLIMRIHNIALFALINLQEYLIARIIPTDNKYTILSVYYALAMTSFFYQGNSNSLSKIDVATGFVGLSNYYPLLVAFLLICHTYSSFTFWLLSLIHRMAEKSRNLTEFSNCKIPSTTLAFACLVRALPVAATMFSLTIQRNHLFAWSVFAPKLLYESCHSLFTWFVLIFVYIFIKIA